MDLFETTKEHSCSWGVRVTPEHGGVMLLLCLMLPLLFSFPLYADPIRHPLVPWIPRESQPTAGELSTLATLLRVFEYRASPEFAQEGKLFSLAETLPEDPWLYWAGCHLWIPGEQPAVDRHFYQFLLQGGIAWIELCVDQGGPLFPEFWGKRFQEWQALHGIAESLRPITSDHVLYRTFYLLSTWEDPYGGGSVYALEIRGRDRLFFLPNLLRSLTARNREGGGGAEPLVRQALNLMMYTVTLDYKTDAIHLPFILERRRRHR